MDTPKTVPASEFTRNFGRYRMRAQREPVAVSSHSQITGYFVSPDEYEEFKRLRESRRSLRHGRAVRGEGRSDPCLAHRCAARSPRQVAQSKMARPMPIPNPEPGLDRRLTGNRPCLI